MAFNPDPFQQAREEVASKSMGQQIWNSSILHNFRSAFSSPGSAASKAADVTLGVGQLLLSLIPLPVIGAVISAATSAINSKVRSELHGRHYTDTGGRCLNPLIWLIKASLPTMPASKLVMICMHFAYSLNRWTGERKN